ncbi:class I SAM-dependent rRNA methyltransferase [Vagococcus xieshaowenii]|uniref:Class I SAM-dependent rRNA methyltransferase n=1 Tax=Vagococcus xieshaowenii TaxID=2562451 RepID=A0AAJ5EDG7_9ENTE|nr:class I SAM-dependent rRNA methyltransferase [Vagococcus xieshaowenii]QCA28135.1 class I SAM-dependent rRNA methyltransferase [Vagococcus xieshaowenii]TFZ39738.1 class I SAM-dependent rRNA methyltransferase [Vagococcus xieshaowenii]
MKIKLKKQASKKMMAGYPLVIEGDLVKSQDQLKTKEWHEFVTDTGQFIGTGYIGKQNKGIGWMVAQEETKMDAEFFTRLFLKAGEKREGFEHNELTNAYRLFNGEGDGLGGMTVDRYGEYAVVSWYNETIYTFKPMLIESLMAAFPMIKGIYEKNRFEQVGLPETQHIAGLEAPEPLMVKENGVTYATYLNEGMMTGIFLDQKNVRRRLADGLASGLDILNTFSYTGAFSVAAAMGGAASTVSVDLAKRSLEKTKEMFEVNQLSLDNNRIVVMDIFDYIRYANRKSLTYDMVILDPPGFARNKKRTFSVVKNYGELVAEVTPLIRPDGYLIASTNVANLPYDKFKEMVEEGIHSEGRRFKKVEEHRLPSDFVTASTFKEGNYLKVLIYQIF